MRFCHTSVACLQWVHNVWGCYLHANALLESELNSSWQCELARRTEAGLKLCCLPDATLKESEVHLKQ